ncbi:MAG: hypothetical protein AABX72_04225 [Nanoarchaeota archaeon]
MSQHKQPSSRFLLIGTLGVVLVLAVYALVTGSVQADQPTGEMQDMMQQMQGMMSGMQEMMDQCEQMMGNGNMGEMMSGMMGSQENSNGGMSQAEHESHHQ